MRVVLAVLALVQAFVYAVVPLAEAREPSSIGAHVEPLGGRQHYSHDETFCAACAARHLTGAPARSSDADLPTDVQHALSPSTPSVLSFHGVHTAASPRAPPTAPRLV